jgi:hypothetical protein
MPAISFTGCSTDLPAAQQKPARRLATAQSKSVHTLRFTSRFCAPNGMLALALVPFIMGCFIFRLNKLPNNFSFLTAKVKPAAPPSRVYETPHQAGPLTTAHHAFKTLALKN